VSEYTPEQSELVIEAAFSAKKCPRSRSEVLNFVDPLVLMFNAADFAALAATLASTCSHGVNSCTDLASALCGGENATAVSPTATALRPTPVQSRGIAPVLLLWTLLLETHPDGVMQIIDKRICYRTVPRDGILSKFQQVAQTAQSEIYHLGGCATVSVDDDSSSAGTSVAGTDSDRDPVSIVEIVIKLSGTCVTAHSLHELFHKLACGQLPILPCALVDAHQLCSDGAESNCVDVFSWYISSQLAGEYSKSANRNGKKSGTAVQEFKKRRTDAVSRPALVEVHRSECGAEEQVKRLKSRRREDLPLLHGNSRKYLLELRLVFDERDAVVDWQTTLLAAESFQTVDVRE
jgi:hypothetical protein